MGIVLAPFQFDHPVILAPMSGVTDQPFRRLVRRFGASLVVTEMIASEAMIRAVRAAMKRCAADRDRGPPAGGPARRLRARGDGRGGAAQCRPRGGDHRHQFRLPGEEGRQQGGRLGADARRDPRGAPSSRRRSRPSTCRSRSRCAPAGTTPTATRRALARIAEQCGIRMITVHGRTRCQLFNGKADWSFIRRVKDAVSIPVVANGDIGTVDEAAQLSRGFRRRRRDDRARRLWPAVVPRPGRAVPRDRPARARSGARRCSATRWSSITRRCSAITAPPVGVRVARKHIGWYSRGLRALGRVPRRDQPPRRSGRRCARASPRSTTPTIDRTAA